MPYLALLALTGPYLALLGLNGSFNLPVGIYINMDPSPSGLLIS